ncbi:hypothetical protein Tco_0682507 [Tanacetum coccineum]|uniref:Reverse transcriptase domain-containing protein n=1 Tax=Tanacetum coccineum TaxID=301880 RepID=A0ABQ4XSE2_9ASTR
MKCSQHYLTQLQEVVLFYNGLDVPTRQILDLRGAIPSKTAVEAKKKQTIQEMAEYSQKWHNGKNQELENFSRRGHRATALGYYQRNNANPSYQERRQSITLLYKSRQMTVPFSCHLDNHYYEEEEGNYGPKFTEAYGASRINDTIPRKEKDPGRLGELAYTKLTVKLADRTVKYPKGITENVLVRIGKFTFTVDFIILDMPEDIKVPLILGRPFLSTTRAKIDVYKRKINLRVGEEKIVFTSVKPASSLIKRVYMLSLRERMELDLEARLMGETLVLNRSLDPFLEDYIKLNDLNEPFELRRNQGDDLMPTIEEGEVIEEFRTRDDELNFLENMDAYRDEGMSDVIFGDHFLRELRIKAKRFEGIVTIYNGDDAVT